MKNNTNKKRKTRKFSIQTKLLVASTIMLVLCAVIVGSGAYRDLKSSLVDFGVQQAQVAAKIAVKSVDGDAIGTIGKGDSGTAEYEEALTALRDVQETCGIKYLYTLYVESETVYYGIDTDTEEPYEPGVEFEETYESLKDVFNGKEYVQDHIEETEDGTLITAYLPIIDSTGNVVAVLGSDYDAAGIQKELNTCVKDVAINATIAVVISNAVLGAVIAVIVKGLRNVDDKIYDLVNSDGDLTKKLVVKTGDETELIAEDVNALVDYIREIMINIAANSEKVKGSSENVAKHLADTEVKITDVSATMEQMSAAMEETSASLTGVNESVEQIHDAILMISDNATEGSSSSNEIMEKAATIHSEAVTNREDALAKAQQMKETVNERIEESKAVEEINILTDNILSITNQTNLLALNANIEAARAGEAGRGFAVVASEIGKLATDSAEAANKIREVSEIVINAVNKLAEESENMVNFMDEVAMTGYEKLLETSESYKDDVERTGSMMQEFAAASEQLKRNIDDIKESVAAVNIAVEESTNGIGNVTIISSEITEGVSEIEKEAHNNMEVAVQLNDEVNKFKLS